MSDRVELTKDERVSIGTAMRGWDTRTEGVIAAVESIVAARVQALTAERDDLQGKNGVSEWMYNRTLAERDAARAELAAANARIRELEAQSVEDHETWLQEVEERDAMLIERDATLDRVTALADDLESGKGWGPGEVEPSDVGYVLRAALTPEGTDRADRVDAEDGGR